MSAGKTLAKRSLLEPFRRDQFFWHPAAHPGSRLRSSCHHLTVSTGRQGVRGQRVGSDGRLLARRSGSRGGRHLARSSGRGGRRSAPAAKRCNLETVQRREPPRTRGCTSGTNGGLKMSAIRLYRENIEHPGHNDAALRRRRHEGRECQKNKKRRARKNEGQGRTIQALGQAASTPESLEPPQGPHGGAGLAAPPARVRGAPGHSSHRQDQAIAAKYPASPTATQHRVASVPVPARANARRSRGLWLNGPELAFLELSLVVVFGPDVRSPDERRHEKGGREGRKAAEQHHREGRAKRRRFARPSKLIGMPQGVEGPRTR